ncbi:hypothetical protein HanXRQr2_Chr01g0039071 [Helianthus annuus]|uniref:Uncharacterized protein n=1 Tax=Helianthus annuus TaxID=4232 RepID=A0A9K3P4U5_HELAN|nr:hypothetical protein HanXRQr2_Chr01g0039071 [Helianthus annuus]KAJ0958346.1 hypothetical protein HanPSC8_Chr01g0037931 [Helianthus annuus]
MSVGVLVVDYLSIWINRFFHSREDCRAFVTLPELPCHSTVHPPH